VIGSDHYSGSVEVGTQVGGHCLRLAFLSD